jgi:membrane protein
VSPYGGTVQGSGGPRRWRDWSAAGFLMQSAWLRQILNLLRRGVSEFRADHCPQMAAAISFHVLFSIFPLAIAAVGIVGLVTRDPHAHDAVFAAVVRAVPLSVDGKQQLRGLLTSVSGGAGALGLLGFLGVLWSASGVMAAVRTALNVAWDTSAKRPFVRGKAVDLVLVVGVFLVTGASLGLTVAASAARQGTRQLPHALRSLAPLAGDAASVAVFLASAALLFATFAFLYRLVPAVPTRVKGIWPGALAATAGFEALQYGFSIYVAHFAAYNKVYGSLGAVIAFLFFIYLASMVFLFGAEIASEYPRLRAGTADPGPPRGAPPDDRRVGVAARRKPIWGDGPGKVGKRGSPKCGPGSMSDA